jgi:hypothetical protein
VSDKKNKDKDKKKGKAKQKPEQSDGTSIATHPRARNQVRRAKAWGGLLGFVIALYLSLSANVPFPQAGMRALAAGALGYVLAWACSVAVWRQLMMAELRALAERAGPLPRAAPPDGGETSP